MRKILIADDELGIRELVRRILSKDYVVVEAQNGEEAVNITHSQKPDLILMDIMMPKKDGYTALSEIKSNPDTKSTPVVMLSGIGLELNKKLADSFGANGYITKPFTGQILKANVDQFLSSKKQSSAT